MPAMNPYFPLYSELDHVGVPTNNGYILCRQDYAHMLTCITEREKFVVPVKARGARAILDFPDELNFSTCPVKYSTQKILLVRNIGNKDSLFHLKARRYAFLQPWLLIYYS